MESRRLERVQSELQSVIASYLLKGFKNPLYGIVSVAQVVCSPDLKHAKVYISVLGSEDQVDQNLEMLEDQVHAIQSHIGKTMRMKNCPKLKFFVGSGGVL